eukprot:CAMPEP_0194278110 /NCGR_PEP_ID=MMETSP0169-20130528/10243_1 /TAXON_ID=218684 /ORGANISM="Corethron pennatum, Strain L29A3" /LENGTH=483 /DNA_ID=CAMNT_0039022231 /DNA_START=125 /DNA_END=1576 /DNA_ORIENTATION=+
MTTNHAISARKSKLAATSIPILHINSSWSGDGIDESRPTRISSPSGYPSESKSGSPSGYPSGSLSDSSSNSSLHEQQKMQQQQKNATTRTTNTTKTTNGTIDKRWSTYRLGDWVLAKGRTSMGMFHDSLAWEYIEALDQMSKRSLPSCKNSDSENQEAIFPYGPKKTTSCWELRNKQLDYRQLKQQCENHPDIADHCPCLCNQDNNVCKNERCVLKNSNGTLLRPTKYVRHIFCDLLENRRHQHQDDTLPRDGDLVIHLRLGDVLNNMNSDEINDVFEYGVSIVPSQIRNMIYHRGHSLGWWHYIKSKCYYRNMLFQLEAATAKSHKNVSLPSTTNTISSNNKKKRAIIVGSAIHQQIGTSTNNSIMYSKLVTQFFVDQGYEVTARLDGLPDNDIAWMSHAPIFVAAGGGFSRLASDCAEYFGGIVFAEANGWSGGLDESCGKAPKPNTPMRTYSWETTPAFWSGKRPWTGIKSYPPEETKWA